MTRVTSVQAVVMQIPHLSSQPQANFEANASAALAFGVDVIIDKLTGPTIAFGPKVTANAEMNIAPFEAVPLTFDASLKMGVYGEVGAKLKVWKIDIADWKKSLTIGNEKTFWSYNYPQDMNNKKNDPVTKVLDNATEYIKKAQEMGKEAFYKGLKK